jgi:multiple sugar transport system permease protein
VRDSENRQAYVLVVPVVAAITLLVIAPIIWGIAISFTNTKVIGANTSYAFTLDAYVRALGDRNIWRLFKVTAIFTLGTVIGSLVLGLSAALILNMNVPGRAVARALIIVPWAVPHVAAALVWEWMLNPNYGLIGYATLGLGLSGGHVNWLSNTTTALPALIVVNVWKTYPFAMVVLLAALQGVRQELLEAAELDGANAFHRFRDVTMPAIAPTMLIAALLLTVWSLGNFVFIFLLTQGGPVHSTETIVMRIYLAAFRLFDASSAFALGSVLLLAAITITFIFGFISRNMQKE